MKEIEDLSAAVSELDSAWSALEGHLAANPPSPPIDLSPLVAATGKLAALAAAMKAHLPVPAVEPAPDSA